MKKKLFILVLALAVAFTFSAMPGFAASRQVTQVAEKDYLIDEDGNEYLMNTWENTYEKGRLIKEHSKYINYDFQWDEETGKDIRIKNGSYIYDDTYKYNSKGLKTARYTKDNGKKTNKVSYKYDKKNRIKSETYYSYKNGKYIKDSKVTYTYKPGKTIREVKSYSDSYEQKVIIYYNSKGRINKEVIFEGGEKTGTTIYKYHTNGNLKKVLWESSNHNDKNIQKYDKKGRMVRDEYIRDGWESVTEYKYYSSGLVKERIIDNIRDYGDDIYKEHSVEKYKYSNYYGSTKKYPELVKIYTDGKLTNKEVRRYKKI